MIVRPASAADAQGIAALWNGMIRDTVFTFTTVEKTPAEVAGLIDARPSAFWVAEAGALAGFVTFGAFRAGPGYAHTVEHTVIVADGFGGQGIGARLMAQAEKAARDQGVHVMVAGISGANEAAVAFHRKMGFAQTGHMPEVGRKHGVWLDLILMQKSLRTS
ncbi:N-acetyltransferase [Sulfitobacter mediterraneus]|uniref:GNAT family N-acetyltransferase n=1 Tax=Sulfitobacter mediterraneus TaxID=83219 RepID=UPI0019332970|nr:GNAT family N-acetyltransferase [Sulfitobacter mediterraneus]MBM1634077.1 N-acetyltransferase [Sulfitobacter mediterraneus]MBM1641408.1 N-acetyltransferase [Sulfitobacter mediterraneus]MBM1645942.1 N-acetyltransferase [Sulfitobacter mediterraneus]MBM1649527.1 N-acetyltransferase [Sulfitobacter mediterraneus]MBM1654010.1 N-acetyltransferase [Sulfitobacter mediterraneus]